MTPMKRVAHRFADVVSMRREISSAAAFGLSIVGDATFDWHEQIVLVLVHPTSGAELELECIVEGGTSFGIGPASVLVKPLAPNAQLLLAAFAAE